MSKYHLPAEEIRRIRRKLGETQAEFAKRLVVDAVTVARWETDQRKCTGLYAKTIAELEKGSLLSTKKESDMQDEEIVTIHLHHVYSFTERLAPILQLLYKEVPLEYREVILRAYQEWFELSAHGSDFFTGVCNETLIHEIGYFCRPIILGPIHPKKATDYENSKLANSHAAIHQIAKKLAPSSDLTQHDTYHNDLYPQERFGCIQMVLDKLLRQDSLLEGDVALLKFYRALLKFAWEEMSAQKALPIPATVSFAFAKVLSIGLTRPLTILVPEFDDDFELECLNESTMRSFRNYQKIN
ncbi:MAG: hypothetical protein KME54_08500 [Tolypothrix brevis GSE-NOS-MK-07-07A]|nr:hypothetical protein [Tolypothrix brevis GSE-NOS-MK-07-07A]